MARGKSLLSDEDNPRCWVCGSTANLHVHHCYPGVGRRSVSDEQGCWVYLCGFHHNQSNHGVHFDKALDTRIRVECQRRWEEREGINVEGGIDDPDHERFRALFFASYI
jgi:hypothetical protein